MNLASVVAVNIIVVAAVVAAIVSSASCQLPRFALKIQRERLNTSYKGEQISYIN